jgi:hypothetical protein
VRYDLERIIRRKSLGTTIEGTFSTRRDAELAIEHLVQEHGFERTDIFVSPEGSENSAGETASGSDLEAKNEDARSDAPLGSAIIVSIDVEDEAKSSVIESVFAEFGGQ